MQDKNSDRCCLNVKLCLVVSLPGVKRGWLCPFCASFFVSSHRFGLYPVTDRHLTISGYEEWFYRLFEEVFYKYCGNGSSGSGNMLLYISLAR